MTKKERFAAIIAWFEKNMPIAESELHHQNAFELLIAVILSAQCTDKRVNMITPRLFHDFPTPEALAAASQEVIFDYIRSVSYPNNKAKHLVKMAQQLVTDFNSTIPEEPEELQTLAGVGRKTANVVASIIYDKPAMAVDTHVFRISNRLGLTTNSKNPYETEMELVKYIPAGLIPKAHHWLILHGRYVCIARKPKCTECGLAPYCYYFGEIKKRLSL
jgi:endonuclease III